MSVRLKTLFIICLTFTGLTGILYVASSRILESTVASAEQSSTSTDVERALAALSNEIAQLDVMLGDWAAWDDTYVFMLERGDAYLESNLGDATLPDLRLNLILYADSLGQVVYGRVFDSSSGRVMPLPPSLLHELEAGGVVAGYSAPSEGVAGVLRLSEGPMIVASQPIVTSDHQGPARGMMTMGRYLDAEEIARISRETRLSVTAFPYDGEGLPDDVASARASLSGVTPVLVQPLTQEIIAGYAMLSDIYGDPCLILKVETPRGSLALARAGMRLFVPALLGVGLIFGAVTMIHIEAIVLSPLARLNKSVMRIASEGDTSFRVESSGSDEVGRLAASVNTMLDALERSHQGRRESELRYRAVVEQASEGIFLFDAETRRILDANTAYCDLLGYTLEELQEHTAYDVIAQDRETVDREIGTALRDGQRIVGEQGHRRKDGTVVHVEVSANVITIGDRLVFCAVARDITERKRAEEALRESEERYALAARGANDGLWDWQLGTDSIHFSDRWKAMAGCGPEEIGSRPEEWFDRVHPDDLPSLRHALSLHRYGSSANFENEHRLRHKDGSYRWMLCRGAAVWGPDGSPARLAGSLTDITEAKRAEERLVYDAMHDALTHLPNRALFLDRLAGAMERARRNKSRRFAVLFLDLDRFKVVNDSLGHMAGDEMLVEVSRRLSSCIRSEDTIARLGGDEFAILLEDIGRLGIASQIAARAQSALAAPIQLRGQEVFTTASIGIAFYHSFYERPEEILRDADIAMYKAKSLGRARHYVFDAESHPQAVALLQLETDLRRALERDELRVLYQPVVSLAQGRIVGYEALVRWQHPSRGLLCPGDFLAVAEETGLIVPLGRWVLQEATREAARWTSDSAAGCDLTVSVNLSSRQFSQRDLVEQVREALSASGLDPSRLILELTEWAIIGNAELAEETLRRLGDLGVRVALDDFGTGYSSLSYLLRFPISMIKIDRSFVSTLEAGHQHAALVRWIISLCRKLRIEVVAEGVETKRHDSLLANMGCQYGQGHFYSVPIEAEGIDELSANFAQHPPVRADRKRKGTDQARQRLEAIRSRAN